MGSLGLSNDPDVAPIYLPAEREGRACLDFHLAELARLRDRGLIAEDAYETVAAETRARRQVIERLALGRAEYDAARRLVNKDERAALNLAERSIRTDPNRQAAWSLALDLRRRLRDDAEALALCEQANALFPAFEVSVAQVRREIEFRTNGTAARADPDAFPLETARAALQRGDDAQVIAHCSARLGLQPDHFDATVLLAFARQRQGELEKALTLYRRLRTFQPENPTWSDWVSTIEQRLAARPNARPTIELVPVPPVEREPVAAPEPGLSWSGVAGEFLQDHWQKLILCLAVLLIVVSSNVAASQLLGPKLWSPVGKCLLALVYTVMFAGLGAGLVKWGAARAGRIMLLTTLIVAPANSMLVGQMRLLTEPSLDRLIVLGLHAVALFLLIRLVARSLGLGKAATIFSVALFTLSAFNATTPPGAGWPWAWQFALFLAPASVFLAAVVWLTTRTEAEPTEDPYETTYFALGLLAFAFVTGAIRTGVFGLDLLPTLYALPVLALSLACVFTSTRLTRFDPDPQHAQWMRFAGLVLSGVGMALALARPPGLSPLLSGNTLAAALIGLGLYASLLRSERKPAYLYFAFGALIVSYFGAFYFAKDLVHAVEEAVRRAAGYEKKLPPPFRAINGLVFNSILAGLSIYFRRVWRDDRLAKHCHYLGLPFSIAACVFSGFEPKAAVACLSGYALLYAVSVRVFWSPWVTYLSTAALALAVYFGSTLWPGTTPAGQACCGALLGLGYWLIAAVLRARGVDLAYRRPLDHAALALSALGVIGATLAIVWVPFTVSLAAAATFLIVTLTAVLVNRDEPADWLGYLAVVCGNVGLALLALEGGRRWHHGLNGAEFATVAAALGLIGAVLGSGIKGVNERGTPSARRAVYPQPLHESALVQIGLALLLCGVHVGGKFGEITTTGSATLAVALGLAGVALALLTRPYPVVGLAHLSIACGLGVWVCVAQVVHGGVLGGFAAYAATCAAYSVALIAAEEMARAVAATRKTRDPDFQATAVPVVDLFAAALPGFEVGLVLAAVGLAVAGLTNGPEAIFTFAAGAVSTFWATRHRRSGALVGMGLALVVAAAWAFTLWRVGWSSYGYAFAWLALTSAACSFAFRCVGRACSSRAVLGFYVLPCVRGAAWMTWPVLLLATVAPMDATRVYPLSVAALAASALTLALLTLDRRRAWFTYRAVLPAVVAVYVVVFNVGKASPDSGYILGLVAVLLALILSAVGFVCRARSGEAIDLDRLFAWPLFHWAVFLTVLAIVPAHRSPWTMLVVGLSFLVLVKGIPTRHWIYAAIASAACAVYYGVLAHGPTGRLVTAAMVGAYQLWLLGLLVRQMEPSLRRWLRLSDRDYDYPFFNAAAVSCAMAVALRMFEPGPWSDSAGLALNVAGFLLLMIKPYPHEAWVHGSVALASTAVGLAAFPRVAAGVLWLPIGMAMANVWWVVSRVFVRFGSPVCRRLGITEGSTSAVFRLWSRAFFVVSTAAVGSLVILTVLATLTGATVAIAPRDALEWAGVLLAIGLGSAFAVADGWKDDRAAVVMGLQGLLVLADWWLAAPGSPLVTRFGMSPLMFLPLSTALLAVATVSAGLRLANRPGSPREFWRTGPEIDPLARLDAFALHAGLLLALLAALMTRAQVNVTTIVTLLLATAAPGLAAVVRRWIAAGYAGSLTWSAAAYFAALVAARRLGLRAEADQAVLVAVGMLGAAAGLWLAAGFLRRGEPRTEPGEAMRLPAGTIALALEQAAFVAGIGAAWGVGVSLIGLHEPGPREALAAVGVLFGLALLAIGLIARWGEEWLVYASQGSLLSGYLYYRHAFPLPAATDAAVLTLFGYLDFGLAEVLHRIGLSRFARPTRSFSLALPVLPLALGLIDGGLAGMRLFCLFTAATFYGVAGLSMRWKPLGYAAAFFYNAFLWLLWGQIGWTLADRPQFFLIPVGLSAILFAEVERSSLGRQPANTIRGLGLSVVYLSLAFPVWQFASFGAWTTLLFVSLAGIFAGIGLRVQIFLWLGLVGFVMDVTYQLGRMGLEHTLAKWAIMLALGLLLILFVALNEKKRIVVTMRDYLEVARQWD